MSISDNHKSTSLWMILIACFAGQCFAQSGLDLGAKDVTRPLRSLYDVDGKRYSLRKLPDLKAVVLAWTSEGCPMSKTYSPRLVEIAKSFEDRGVRFFIIDSSPQDSVAFMRNWAIQHKTNFPLIRDERGRLAKDLGVTRTTDVLVFDSALKLKYRGAIDDQYGFKRSTDPTTGKVGTYRKEKPSVHYLKDALEVVVAGQERKLMNTEPWGCAIGSWPAEKPTETAAPTFYGEIQQIFEKRCNECHHKGGSAPFSLQSYKRASGWGDTIVEVIDSGAMPPWNANPEHGTFSNARILTDNEKSKIRAWARGGTPEGKVIKPDAARVYDDTWRIGKPDLILEAPEFEVPAEGLLTYQYYRVEKVFEKDTWIKAAEVKSTNAEVVHHVLMFLSSPRGRSKELYAPYRPRTNFMELVQGAKQNEARFFLRKARQAQFSRSTGEGIEAGQKAKAAGYRERMRTSRQNGLLGYFLSSLPGRDVRIFPENQGKFIPAGTTMVFQFHFTPNGLPTKTSTKLGLRFWDAPPKEVVNTHSLATLALRIPAGEKKYVREVTFKLPRDGTLLSLHPHMHYRGKSFRYEVQYPDGKNEILLDVPDYDFDWQHEYQLAEPKLLKAGSVLKGTAVYDNSDGNPYNPNSKKEVFFGLQSMDEMFVGYFSIIWADSLPADSIK